MKKLYLLLLAILLNVGLVSAQTPIFEGVELHSINFEIGTYSPSMDGWNDVLLPSYGVNNEYGTNVALGGNLKFALPLDLQFRLGANYWADEVGNGSNAAISSTRTRFWRYGFGLFYAPSSLEFGGDTPIQPYGGLDVQLYSIKSEIQQGTVEYNNDGTDVMYTPVLGADMHIFGDMNLGLEFRYNLGSYDQKDQLNQNVQVSAKGFEWRLMFGYRF